MVPSQSFDELSEQNVNNRAQLDVLRRYFSRFDASAGKVAMITIDESVSSSMSFDDRAELVSQAAAVVTFATIAPAVLTAIKPTGYTMAPPSSDRFKPYHAGFDGDFVASSVGIKLGATHLDLVREVKPRHLIEGFRSPSNEYLELLGEVFALDRNDKARNRIIRPISLFAECHTNAEELSDFFKIVMTGTVFEILSETFGSRSEKRGPVANQIDRLCGASLQQETRQLLQDDGTMKDETHSKAAWWFCDFYRLRNKIAHGDPVRQSDLRFSETPISWLTHHIISDVVLTDMVLRLAFDSVEKSTPVTQNEGIEREIRKRSLLSDIGKAYKAMGWSNGTKNP